MRKTELHYQTASVKRCWRRIYDIEVNGQPDLALVEEEQLESKGQEINKTIITVGKTKKKRYTIDRQKLENRIDETATEEEDRIEKETLPF